MHPRDQSMNSTLVPLRTIFPSSAIDDGDLASWHALITGAGRRRTAVADKINADDPVISREVRSDVIPPVDCTAKPMNKDDCGSSASHLHIRRYDRTLYDLTTVTGRRRAGLGVDPEDVNRECNDAQRDGRNNYRSHGNCLLPRNEI
jgi:hypothetical protein